MNRRLLALVPNGLSAARLALGLAVPFVPTDWRVWIVAAAAATDLFDGLAARWLRAETAAGRLLDPIADKAFVLALVGTLIADGTLHPLWAAGLALRDVVVTVGLAAVVARRQWERARRLRPSVAGKVATAGQFVALLALTVRGGAPVWLLGAVTALSGAAAVDYARRFFAARADAPGAGPAAPEGQ